jgi:predicted RNA-binding protein
MCEFNVLLNGKIQFKDVVYAKAENVRVITKNVLGQAKIFENCRIVEVDVNSAKLILNEISKE